MFSREKREQSAKEGTQKVTSKEISNDWKVGSNYDLYRIPNTT